MRLSSGGRCVCSADGPSLGVAVVMMPLRRSSPLRPSSTSLQRSPLRQAQERASLRSLGGGESMRTANRSRSGGGGGPGLGQEVAARLYEPPPVPPPPPLLYRRLSLAEKARAASAEHADLQRSKDDGGPPEETKRVEEAIEVAAPSEVERTDVNGSGPVPPIAMMPLRPARRYVDDARRNWEQEPVQLHAHLALATCGDAGVPACSLDDGEPFLHGPRRRGDMVIGGVPLLPPQNTQLSIDVPSARWTAGDAATYNAPGSQMKNWEPQALVDGRGRPLRPQTTLVSSTLVSGGCLRDSERRVVGCVVQPRFAPRGADSVAF